MDSLLQVSLPTDLLGWIKLVSFVAAAALVVYQHWKAGTLMGLVKTLVSGIEAPAAEDSGAVKRAVKKVSVARGTEKKLAVIVEGVTSQMAAAGLKAVEDNTDARGIEKIAEVVK